MVEDLVRIFKYQALGNSYLVLDPHFGLPKKLVEPTSWGPSRPRSQFVRLLCDVSNGVGSNGLLFGPLPALVKNRYRLLIINSDGTSAGFSGNGTRIFAKYLMDSKTVLPGESIEIEIPDDDSFPSVAWNIAPTQLPLKIDGHIEVTAPHVPQFGTQAVRAAPNMCVQLPAVIGNGSIAKYMIPALSEVGQSIYGSSKAWSSSVLLNIGNPHCVTFVSEPSQVPTLELLRTHDEALKAIAFRSERVTPLFADGANLQWVWLESRQRLQLVVYERGEGPTPASGSSACAAACAAFSLKLIDNDVDVVMPGGILAVHLQGTPDEIKRVTLVGDAHRILDGVVSVSG
jgi:diaminopimelate epimerase